ncbi:MAG: PLP-dependent aminotransferase family protein [Alphaproteobacteria bacterium]|nr:PLP-dependent aminotransferase family protein [Alphaproteobacteria bacterium]
MPAALGCLCVDATSTVPLRRQIADAIRDAILKGKLPFNALLPTSSELADHLGVARNTVVAAYALLRNDGFISGNTRRGTRVILPVRASPSNTILPSANTTIRVAARAERHLRTTIIRHADGAPFCLNTVSASFYPRAQLGNKLAKLFLGSQERIAVTKSSDYRLLFKRFREAVCGHVLLTRGIKCHEHQVIPVAGPEAAIDLIARVLIDPGHTVKLLEPVLDCVVSALELVGAHIYPVGRHADALARSATDLPPARVLFVQPSAVFPFGSCVSESARADIVSRATAENAIIFEYDVDHPLLRLGRACETLFTKDRRERTIYYGGLSESLGLGTELGYLIVPDAFVSHFSEMSLRTKKLPMLQIAEAIAHMIERDELTAHWKDVRCAYAERMDWLCSQLDAQFKKQPFATPPGGTHYALILSSELEADAICRQLSCEGASTVPLGHFLRHPPEENGIILSLKYTTKSAITNLVARLSDLCRGYPPLPAAVNAWTQG